MKPFLACVLLLPCLAVAQTIPRVSSAEVTGTYRSKGGSLFAIQSLGSNQIRVQFDGRYLYYPLGKPMVNVGHALGVANIQADSALFKPFPDLDCVIVLTFQQGNRLAVKQRSPDGYCGFGHNVYATDLYRKISHKKPRFEAE